MCIKTYLETSRIYLIRSYNSDAGSQTDNIKVKQVLFTELVFIAIQKKFFYQ